MAVIISDMEHIPKSCFDCDFHNYHVCDMTGNYIEQNYDDCTRADDCPLKEVPSGKCIDCKWWKDSNGEYRRGCGAESKCPINRIEVYEGNGYCYMFKPQESEG